ncbi:myb-like protein X [Trichomycterus rosablanca]|uniref:myb-like protein X n=1 Tax=Trichomycterus rosablanca TaxID=2290929 RepID=UPI002F355857
MAATEANAEPVQVESTETKADEEPANAESAPAPPEETQPTTEEPQSTEQSADKVKPAPEKIWDSFLNKSGLGKVMGGKKKKEHGTVAEDAVAEETDKASVTNENNQESAEPKDQESSEPAKADEAETAGQGTDKVPENEEASQEQKTPGAKPKQGEKSSVRDFIRKPVAMIFSHKSTEKKESSGEASKHGKVRSRSLDRMEDADASMVVVEQNEDAQAPEETEKSTSQTAKPIKRWHSFKKLMGQKSHKKSTEEVKEVEGAEGGSTDAPGRTGTLDSTKSEHSGQKKWKLKRSWTFQGLKRDPSFAEIHKPKDKDSSDSVKDKNATEADQGATQVSEESKVIGEEETQEEKPNAEGEEEKEATATPPRSKSVDQHATEIWTSFKKRVIPKSKKAADACGGEEEPTGEQEQTEDPQAGKDSAKTGKSKRTHFNRAVSLKNFILRKGKSASMDVGESIAVQKESEEETKDIDGSPDTSGTTEPQGESENQAAAQTESSNGAQVADEHKSSDEEEKSLPNRPSGQQSDTPTVSSEGGDQTEPTVEPKTNGENGCSNTATEDTTANSHDPPTQNDVEKQEETNQENGNSSDKTCSKDGKILNQDEMCGTENAVAQSEKKAGNA